MTPITTTLALVDIWTVTLIVIELIVGALVAWLLLREKQREARITRLEQNLEQRAEQLIESKLSGVATELEGVVNLFNDRINNIRDRLTAGDREFTDLDKRDRELETRFNHRFDQLKDYLHANFATKEDAATLHRRIDALKKAS